METVATVASRCPHCHRRLSAPARLVDTIVHCPACHERFRLHPPTAEDRLREEAERLGFGVVDLEQAPADRKAIEAVAGSIARQERILPYALDGDTLVVAMGAPPGPDALDRLRFILNRSVHVVVARPEQVLQALDAAYGKPKHETPAPVAATRIDFVEMAPRAAEDDEEEPGDAMPDPDGPAVIRLVQDLIQEGLQCGAARLLIMPVKQTVKIAYRIRDVNCTRDNVAASMLYPTLVKLMTMTSLSGGVKLRVGGHERRLRVSFKPARYGLSALIELPGDAAAAAEACRARAAKLGFKFNPLDELRVSAHLRELVPESVAREFRVLPVERDGETLVVAIADPRAAESLDRLRFILNRPIATVMAPEGAILAAIERSYGSADPDAAELLQAGLAQPVQPPAEEQLQAVEPQPRSARAAAAALLAHLRRICTDKGLQLFESLRARPKICRQDHATGVLEVVFPQSHLMAHLPRPARRYVENKIWVLREAIISRLENYLERDRLARGLAMTFSHYLCYRALAEGQEESINPATARDAWINFLHGFALQAFPTIDSNGALAALVTEQLDQLAQKIAQFLDSPEMVVEPAAARRWMQLTDQQTTTEDLVDYRSPTVVHLVDLLLAETIHWRASRLVLVPGPEMVEVACLVQNTPYPREPLPLRLLYPVLARISELAGPTGRWQYAEADRERDLSARFHCVDLGLAASVDVAPDEQAAEECRALAAEVNRPLADLREVEIPEAILDSVSKGAALKKRAMPLSLAENTLTVALSRPPSPRRLDELRLAFNRMIEYVLAPEDEIVAAVYRHYDAMPLAHAVSPAAVALLRAPAGKEP